MGELVFHAVVATLEALFELVTVRTASILLPIISFGTLTTNPPPPHPPAYGEHRPIFVGPLMSMLFGLVFWVIAAMAFVAIIR